MQYAFSDNVSSLQPSAIREILKFTSMPGVISFAAGNPASEAFPVDHIRQISADLLQKDPLLALQYNIEGYPAAELLKKRMEAQQCFDPPADDLITTSGAQQANELACKVLLNRGDTMLCVNLPASSARSMRSVPTASIWLAFPWNRTAWI
ncbi:MAG: hypothetical protein ACLT2C_08580 [Ruminococcus sp.]